MGGKLAAARKPAYAVGDRVANRHTVRVKMPGRRRRWLHLLTGCVWEVLRVVEREPRLRRTPMYALAAVGVTGPQFEIERTEGRLRPLGRSE